MIDFFRKSATMTKRVSGVASLKGAPTVNPRPQVRYTHVGTFSDDGGALASVLLEVAETEEARRRGLMGRDELPGVCGMLFRGLSGGGSFWMKGCRIPLDIAFIGGDGRIEKICSMKVDDGDERYEYGDGIACAVEVPEKFFRKNEICVGCRFSCRPLRKEGGNG